MRIIFLSLLIILGAVEVSFSQITRSTTFDDREICEKEKAIWREFGNGCVDSCRAKLDRFSVCTMALTYGCDCGKNRCFDEGKCVKISDYKEKFEQEQAAEKEELELQKEARKDDYRRVRNDILNNLNKKKIEEEQNNAANQGNSGATKSKPNNNLSQFIKPDAPSKPGSNAIVDTITKPVREDKNNASIPNQNGVAPVQQKFQIPEFFSKKKNDDSKKDDSKNNAIADDLVKTDQQNNISSGDNNSDDTLPKIPLPN